MELLRGRKGRLVNLIAKPEDTVTVNVLVVGKRAQRAVPGQKNPGVDLSQAERETVGQREDRIPERSGHLVRRPGTDALEGCAFALCSGARLRGREEWALMTNTEKGFWPKRQPVP